MKTLIAAIALMALPAVAQAEAPPPPAPEAPKMKCCCKDMTKPMACCEEHGRGDAGEGGHSGHDMDGERP